MDTMDNILLLKYQQKYCGKGGKAQYQQIPNHGVLHHFLLRRLALVISHMREQLKTIRDEACPSGRWALMWIPLSRKSRAASSTVRPLAS